MSNEGSARRTCRYRANPETACTMVGGRAVLCNPRTSKVVVLNESASLLWNALLGEARTPRELALALVGEYGGEIDEERAGREVEEFLSVLEDRGLVLREEGGCDR